MEVLVPIKRVIDPYVKINVLKDGSGVDTNNVKMAINPFDEIALEEAIRLKEQNKVSKITVASIGDEKTQESLRQALAMGADEAIFVNCQTPTMLTPLNIAKILTKISADMGDNLKLIIMGKQAIDNDCNQTGQMLATLKQWPQATFASKIEFTSEDLLQVAREVDGGIETVELSLPAVITTDLRLNEPRYVSLPNIMKAKRKPIKEISLTDLNLKLNNNLSILKVSSPDPRPPGQMLESVAQLVDKLKNQEKII